MNPLSLLKDALTLGLFALQVLIRPYAMYLLASELIYPVGGLISLAGIPLLPSFFLGQLACQFLTSHLTALPTREILKEWRHAGIQDFVKESFPMFFISLAVGIFFMPTLAAQLGFALILTINLFFIDMSGLLGQALYFLMILAGGAIEAFLSIESPKEGLSTPIFSERVQAAYRATVKQLWEEGPICKHDKTQTSGYPVNKQP